MKHLHSNIPVCLVLFFVICQIQMFSVQAQGPLFSILPFEEQDSVSSHVSQPAVERQRPQASALGKLLLRRPNQSGQYRHNSRFSDVACSGCWAILRDLSPPQKALRTAETYDFADITKKAMLNNGW